MNPENFHDYQREAYEWMRNRTEAFLWLGLGLGKTVVAATACQNIVERLPGVGRVLVVGTKNIVEHTWPGEFAKWDHLHGVSYATCAGALRKRIDAVESRPDFLLVNYENLVWFEKFCEGREDLIPQILVLDEISKMKAHGTKRFKALQKLVPFFHRRFGLTATPAAENYNGLWAQEASISRGRRLGRNITQFRKQYTSERWAGERVTYTVGPKAKLEIESKLEPVTLNMRSEDYLELSKPLTIDIPVPWTPDGYAMHEAMSQKFIVEHEGENVAAANIGVMLNKLRQICGGCIYDEQGEPSTVDESKLDVCLETFEALNGEPVVIFFQYKWEQAQLLERIPGARGKLDVETLAAWNRGEIPALVLHPASAGHGLNLQGPCRNVVWYSLPWSLEHYLQANGRIDRQGQTEDVRIYRLMRNGTDLDVLAKLEGKLGEQADLLERMKSRT